MNRKSFELKFCFLFVSIAFAFFLGLPLANLAYKSLQTGSGTGLGNYAAILTDDAFLTAFRNSFAISALEAAITTAAAFILAYGLHLTRIPGKIKEGLQLVVMMPRAAVSDLRLLGAFDFVYCLYPAAGVFSAI